MLKGLISKVFGTRHERERKRVQPILDEIHQIEARLGGGRRGIGGSIGVNWQSATSVLVDPSGATQSPGDLYFSPDSDQRRIDRNRAASGRAGDAAFIAMLLICGARPVWRRLGRGIHP